MSVERCITCENDIDTDFDLGNYCPECDVFVCDTCAVVDCCPECGAMLDV